MKRPDKNKLVLISFSKEVVKACRETMPEYKACLISSLKEFSKSGFPDKYLGELEWSGSQGLLYKESAPVSKEWLVKAGGEDGLLMAWTVDTRDAALRAVSLGARFIGTNRPGALRTELEPAAASRP